MADEYDALEAAASSFKAAAGLTEPAEDRREDRHRSRDDRDRREHRSRDTRERDDREDRGDRHRERSDREPDARRDRSDRESHRGDRGNDRNGREREQESRGTRRPREEYEHPPRDGRDRRPRYENEYAAAPPRRRSPGMVARSMRDDVPDYGRLPPREYRDDHRGGGRDFDRRRDDRQDGRGGGGGGGGGRDRGRERFGSPERARSPTPPGAVPLSERRRIRPSKWDEKLPEFEHLSAMQAKMTGQFPAPGPNRQPIPAIAGSAGYPGAPGYIPGVGMAGTNAIGGPVRQSKRLYVGNVPPEATEHGMAEFFNSKMRENKFAVDLPGEPVANLQLNHDKSYAFIEFRIPEEATSAMAFDGIVFHGTPLKVRRPKDYVGPEGPLGTLYVPGVIGTTVADTPNKIYIGGLPTYLQDEQVVELLKSFGELKSFNLVKEGSGQTGVSKGFAFCEYVDEAVTDMAIQGLNGFQLADRTLVVQRAAQGRGSNMSTAFGTGANASPSGMSGIPRTLAELAPNIIASAAAADASAAPTSRCMLMLNMVTPEELVDDQDYQDILEDINDECSKYGEVEGVRVPRPVKRDAKWMPGETAAASKAAAQQADEEAGVGRVFVLFKDLDGVGKALKAIAGRQFGGRTILCASVSEDEFLGPAPPPPPPAEPPSLEDATAAFLADINA